MTWSLDVAIFCSGMPFQGDTLEHKSLGGSETAALCVARELAKRGHNVRVFSNTDRPGKYDGVTYHPAGDWKAFAQMIPHDVTIIQRIPEAFTMPTNSRLNYLWCHDLALGRQANAYRGVMWNVDRIFVVSEFMKSQYQEVYGLPDESYHVTRNGLELNRFTALPADLVRDRKKLLFCARPERGLDILLAAIMPRLLERDPGLHLAIAGYDYNPDHMQPFYQQIDRMTRLLGDRAKHLGYLTKDALYREYATAGVYVYPTPSPIARGFAEVSCISAMEAQACGTPIVTSKRGALPETVAEGAGILIEGMPDTPEYQQAFVEAVLRYVNDDQAWQAASDAGKAKAQTLDWSGVAEEWERVFLQDLAAHNGNRTTLAAHFIRRSDIIAAKETLQGEDNPLAQSLRDRIAKDWWFTDGHYRDEYERIGQTHRPDFTGETNETRFGLVRERIAASGAKRVLDVGCAHGAYTVGLSNALPEVTFVGVDIDKHGIDWAHRFRAEKAKHPDRLSFRVGDHTVDLSDQEPFDLLYLGETLEHVPCPWEFVTALERWVKPGGKVLITVPYGPWEFLSYDTYPHRAHIWEYDYHDLRDLFGKKPNFGIDTQPALVNDLTGEAHGWHLITYDADQQPCGPIDMARKLALQRPRQTVSADIIAGPNAEETLHWCLRSIKPHVDQIVIVDTGMSPEGRRIVGQYPVTIVPGPDPKAEGFEAPRNAGLAHCHGDWILWLDTDEKLLDAHNLTKYLRANLFNGYSIRQHHFAADTTFKADMPVRLFRNRLVDGKAMRWYGMIHEHPELGLNEGPGISIVLADVHIAHVGYLTEHGRRKRFARNYPLLQADMAKYPDRLLQKHFICRDNMLMVMYELQQNGGQVTPTVYQRCMETIALWRQYFRGKPGYMNADTLGYYSDACRILGIGFDFKFELAAGRDGTAPNGTGPVTHRFATMEDLDAEMGWRVHAAVGEYASERW